MVSEGPGFQPIPNPYIVGNPIEDRRMFFGREDDFEYIRKKVTGNRKGGLIVLCGTRRSGKTSILFQIKGGRLGREFMPVLLDMQSMTVQHDREFLAQLGREIAAALDDPVLGERARAIEAAANPHASFQALLPAFDAALRGRNLVLMFDEYELFESHIDRGTLSVEIFGLFAAWMESRQGVFVIFTGSDRIETRNSQYWTAFLGKAQHRRISFLSRADTLRLIGEPVEGLVTHADGVPETIWRLTAGQPFYTQVLCQTLVDHLNEGRRRETSPENVEAVVGEIVESPLPQMIFSWTSLTELEKLALSVVAELGREKGVQVAPAEIMAYCEREKLGCRPEPGSLKEALERLFHRDLLEKDAGGESYFFKMDLWRRWIARMHSIWQVLDEIGAAGRKGIPGLQRVGRGRRRALWLALAGALVVAVAAPLLYRLASAPAGGGSPAAMFGPAVADSTLLTVTSEPLGATVFLDRTRIGTTPLRELPVPARGGQLCLELAGYRTACDSLALAKDEPASLAFALEELTGSLRVVSDPTGARIFLDGRDSGRVTPAVLAGLPVARRHDVRLALAGHGERTLPGVEVLPDSTLTVGGPLAVATHPLTIISEPPGAALVLDGQALDGRTPRSLDGVAEGRHTIALSLDGHQRAERAFTVPVPDGMLSIPLEPLPPGRLLFQISPYAELWIDGELVNQAAVRHAVDNLRPGSHRCRLRHAWGELDTTVVVESGRETVVRHTFSDPEGSR